VCAVCVMEGMCVSLNEIVECMCVYAVGGVFVCWVCVCLYVCMYVCACMWWVVCVVVWVGEIYACMCACV